LLSGRERSFTWRDGERLIRFGAGALAEAPELLAAEGFDGYVLVTTGRALDSTPGAAALAEGAVAVLEVPGGRVPEASAAVRADVGGRPLVALGGGRVIDSAKAIAAADGLRCAAVPTTLSGAELTQIHRLPVGVERPRGGLVRPALALADPDVMASHPPQAVAASAMNALATEPRRCTRRAPTRWPSWWRGAGPSSSPRGSSRPSPRASRSPSARCCAPTRSTPLGWRCTTSSARPSSRWPGRRTRRRTP
jgi:hypothetical protein